MKLDKIRFARVVQFIGKQMDEAELSELDNLIEIPPLPIPYAPVGPVDELLRCMRVAHEGKLIEAIKAYRSLTGAGLKEAKDAVERYRQPVKQSVDRSSEVIQCNEATLGHILRTAKDD